MRAGTGERERTIRLLVLGVGLSTFGAGLVLPFLAIYLVERPGGGLALSGGFYAVVAIAGFLAAVVVAVRRGEIDRWTLATAGLTASGLGFTGLVLGAGPVPVLLCALVIGLGQSAVGASLTPILSALAPAGQNREVFARRYRATNLGLALGALAAGGLVALVGPTVTGWLVLLDAASFVPLLVIVVVARRRHAAAPLAVTPETRPSGRLAWRDVPLGLLFFQLAATAFGFSQLDAVAPLTATRLMGADLSVAALLLLVNAGAVVLLQKPTGKLLRDHTEIVGLRVVIGLWVTSFVVVGLCSLGPLSVRLTGLVVFAVVFSAGQCAYSFSYHPWLMRTVPAEHQVRVSALSNAMAGTGAALGPVVGTTLVGVGSAPLVWAVTALGCLLAAIPLVRRRVSNAGRAPSSMSASATQRRSESRAIQS